ncbi:unnamed protein product [Phaedon cochleariae]|uniref:C2H2-type domain-containing protein n=1 Tax=Phaedon cochleariae TaxID=80249 RepID=A0A9P0DXB1_PHACE|nr:unnamed protein product [Phaedon cochleariae]
MTCTSFDFPTISIVPNEAISSMADENLETVAISSPCPMDIMNSSSGRLFEPLIKQEATDPSSEPRIKVEQLSIEHLDIKKEDEVDDTAESDLETDIVIKDEKVKIEKQECDEIPLFEVCDKRVKTDVEVNDQEADIKEEPEDETDNIYICTSCNEIYESKEDLINHKKETAGCHEHKICDKCEVKSESGFTCVWELEDHLKTVHGVEIQDEIQELQLQKNEDALKSYGTKKLYPCRFCPKVLKRSYIRICHERIHTGEKPYQCSVCGKSFINTSNLHDHEAIHSGERRFSCSFCEKTFICSSNRKRHEKSHEKEKCFKCPFCDDFFSSRILLKEHKKTHSETPYACRLCPRLFSSNYSRTRHEKVHSRSKPLELKKIRHSFLSTELINEEYEMNDTAQKLNCASCDVCLKSFACDAKLQLHRKIHTEEKLFACGSCEKSFTSSCLLKKHEIIHSSVKPFSCSYCPKSFLHDYKRIQHERIHNGEKPYMCRYCDKSFSTHSIASDHENTHTGKRRYTCDVCNRRFTRKGSLHIHTRVHTGEKPCNCNICGKVFTYLSSLRKHERIHKS